MELGRGGTGLVSAAIARGIGGFSKLVVLKTTRPEVDADSDTVRMLLNEARLHSRMQHPNVVEVYEVTQRSGLPVIVMEYLDGQHLGQLLSRAFKSKEYDIRGLLSVVCGVLEGLEYAHTLTDFDGQPLGIVHRDVTPHNVMITYDGRVKLLDFGIAKQQVQPHETRTGIIKGKLGYMPPEQVEGLPLDARADVFAVGVMIWEIVARRRLWGARGDAEIIRALICSELPRLTDVVPEAPGALAEICDRAMATSVDDRHASAGELLEDLRAYLNDQGGAASAKELAELVETHCGDLRENDRLKLDEELAKFSRGRDADDAGSGFGRLVSPRPTVPAGGSPRTGFNTGTAHGVEVPESIASGGGPSPKRRTGVWLLSLAAGALLVGSMARAFLEAPDSAQQPTSAASAPSVAAGDGIAPVENAVAEVMLSVSATPPQAQLWLDGEKLSNPYQGRRPADEREHELRVEADGHVELVRGVRLTSDLDLTLELEPQPQSKPSPEAPPRASAKPAPGRARATPKRRRKTAKRGGSPERSAKPPRAAASTAAKPRCDIPYFFDEQGIKHYRRECLGN